MLMFGLRLGPDPRVVVTTTPKPVKIILIADPTTVITRGSTYDNRANLAPAFLAQISRNTRALVSAARKSTPRSSTTCPERYGTEQ
jgi:phage terminase large subunit-like protein